MLLQTPECFALVSRCAGDAAAFKCSSGIPTSDFVNLSCNFHIQVGNSCDDMILKTQAGRFGGCSIFGVMAQFITNVSLC